MKRFIAIMALALVGLVRADDKKDVVVELDDLKAKAPADWVSEKTTGEFRVYQFRIPKAEDDKDDGELVIYSGNLGPDKANLQRWKDSFQPPEGKKIDDVTKESNPKIGGYEAVMLQLEGTYKARERPGDPSSKLILKPDYKFTGIILKTKNQTYYIKFTAPAKTMEKHEKAFKAWLEALK
jgi:hypothetical protein